MDVAFCILPLLTFGCKFALNAWLISPGAIDLSGVVPLPRKSDFERFTKEEIVDIFMQVSLTSEETNRICKEWRKI